MVDFLVYLTFVHAESPLRGSPLANSCSSKPVTQTPPKYISFVLVVISSGNEKYVSGSQRIVRQYSRETEVFQLP